MIKDISNRMMRDFATCLARTARPPSPRPAAPPSLRRGGTRGRRRGRPCGRPPAAEAARQSRARDRARPKAPPGAEAKPVKGISLFFSVLWERIKWLFGRAPPLALARHG